MKISLERLFSDPPITGPDLSGVAWHPDGTRFTYLEKSPEGTGKDLWAFTLETGARQRLVEGRAVAPAGEETEAGIQLAGYQWFPDGERLLLLGKSLWEFTLADSTLRLLAENVDSEVSPGLSAAARYLAFVRENNLWYLEVESGEQTQVTTDGSATVLNGKLDWVYWEELGHRKQWRAFEWAPDEEKLAFLRLDQSAVPEYPLVDTRVTHPTTTQQRYPKAGDPSSTAAVCLYHLDSGALLTVPLGSRAEYLGPELAWTPDSAAVCFTELQRSQQALQLRRLSPEAGLATLLSETDEFWLNHIGPPVFLEDGSGFLWLSERSGWAHLYLYAMEGECRRPLTHGEWQVERVHGIRGAWVYVTGSGPDARERHLYRVALDGSGWEQLTPSGGVHATRLQPTGSWALITSATPETPAETWLLNEAGTRHATVHQPDAAWREYAWARSEFHDVTAPDGTLLHGRLVLPPDFDPGVRYPVVLHVYGGPHAQTVRKGWSGDDPLEQLLAQEGYLVWRLDNRGSWGRGHGFETPVNRILGSQELEDQLAGVAFLKQLPYVDPDRFGVTGWSYGGYLTLYSLTHAPDVWRCGVAGAPVTDWTLYDSVYTERYMGTPAENPEGYRKASVLDAASELAAPVLLIHGTDDDNVHLQHTLQLVEAFQRARKPYELLVQPGQKHGFQGKEVRLYLHERILEFFRHHL